MNINRFSNGVTPSPGPCVDQVADIPQMYVSAS